MSELAKIIFGKTGSLILNKKQVASLIGKSVAYVDAAIHENRLEKIPKYKKPIWGIEFHIEDIVDFIEEKQSKEVA